MKKILFLIFLFCVSGMKLYAQEHSNAIALEYQVSFPSGNLKDYIAKTSWRGIGFEYRQNVTEKLFWGVEVGWNVFYEKREDATYTDGTISITGTQFRYESAVPMMVNVGMDFKSFNIAKPYASLGIGALYNRTRMDVGVYTLDKEAWHFLLKPELGVIISPTEGTGIIFNVNYEAGFNNSSSKAINYFGLNLGFVLNEL